MKPIIFNIDAVKAILDGRKTQFRMPIKLEDNTLIPTGYVVASTDRKRNGCYSFGKNKEHDLEYSKSKYKVDDILYVRETWTLGESFSVSPETDYYCIRNDLGNKIFYKADTKDNFFDPDNICKWKPSVHMPKEYARIFLEITDVRVERLQDISNDDIYSEGIKRYSHKTLKKAFDNNNLSQLAKGLKLEWINTWNKTAKDGYKWEDNPYVFVYDFIVKEKYEEKINVSR